MTTMLTACSQGESQAPAAAAVEACENAAMQQFDVDSAGDVADPRALPVQDGDSFEVTGSAEGVDRACTWLRTQSAGGVTVKTSIVER
ncbi:hypothetical protein [Quadrisphaera setariae]|uniref:Uncharacterized protein n=1 Tax=Quadrisphaera setariae TaxID=2593304 RepID=A0A5C8ZKC4_9ACTN|nr:hypothetical protein [Quadrisphaera setariae]TXR57573.1 hypothetical protein FMM08_04960 [Quadrisphaera setariae]